MRKLIVLCTMLFSLNAFAGVSGVRCFQVQTPVLVGYQVNEILGIEVTVDEKGVAGEFGFGIDTKGTSRVEDIKYVEMYYTGTKNRLSGTHRFGGRFHHGDAVGIYDRMTLKAGKYYFFVSFAMKDTADYKGRVDAGCTWFSYAGKKIRVKTGRPAVVKRMGVKIRAAW